MLKHPDGKLIDPLSVPIISLAPNPWNTNRVSAENEAKIDASLKRLGWFKPVTVRELDDGTLQILGGQHRWEAGVRAGYTEVPIFNVGVVSDERAKEIGLADNARYGDDDPLALGAMIKDLGTGELATFLPHDEKDFLAMFTASSIALDALDLIPDNTTPDLSAAGATATHQTLRYKVPVEDIAWITALIEQRMRTKNFSAEDSQTNAGNALVDILKEHK